MLESIEARQDPTAPFGHWERGDDGERTLGHDRSNAGSRRGASELEANPLNPASFDYLLESRHGAIDVVQEVSGTSDDLIARADSWTSTGFAYGSNRFRICSRR